LTANKNSFTAALIESTSTQALKARLVQGSITIKKLVQQTLSVRSGSFLKNLCIFFQNLYKRFYFLYKKQRTCRHVSRNCQFLYLEVCPKKN